LIPICWCDICSFIIIRWICMELSHVLPNIYLHFINLYYFLIHPFYGLLCLFFLFRTVQNQTSLPKVLPTFYKTYTFINHQTPQNDLLIPYYWYSLGKLFTKNEQRALVFYRLPLSLLLHPALFRTHFIS